eukprot:GDKJ01042386.1.p1 GENE.GDKJ01042386.1~~GDKJ01042386.1.p1  ORF type:complete len:1280 (-),score=398.19 GDKJ01042386.1:669-4508(-)
MNKSSEQYIPVSSPIVDSPAMPADDSFVNSLAMVLDHLISLSVGESYSVSHFHAVSPPPISILDYLVHLQTYFRCSTECFVTSLIFIDRVVKSNPTFVVNIMSIHRVILTSLLLSIKFFEDQRFETAYYARVGGITYEELQLLEIKFLELISWRLHITAAEYMQYVKEVGCAINMSSPSTCRSKPSSSSLQQNNDAPPVSTTNIAIAATTAAISAFPHVSTVSTASSSPLSCRADAKINNNNKANNSHSPPPAASSSAATNTVSRPSSSHADFSVRPQSTPNPSSTSSTFPQPSRASPLVSGSFATQQHVATATSKSSPCSLAYTPSSYQQPHRNNIHQQQQQQPYAMASASGLKKISTCQNPHNIHQNIKQLQTNQFPLSPPIHGMTHQPQSLSSQRASLNVFPNAANSLSRPVSSPNASSRPCFNPRPLLEEFRHPRALQSLIQDTLQSSRAYAAVTFNQLNNSNNQLQMNSSLNTSQVASASATTSKSLLMNAPPIRGYKNTNLAPASSSSSSSSRTSQHVIVTQNEHTSSCINTKTTDLIENTNNNNSAILHSSQPAAVALSKPSSTPFPLYCRRQNGSTTAETLSTTATHPYSSSFSANVHARAASPCVSSSSLLPPSFLHDDVNMTSLPSPRELRETPPSSQSSQIAPIASTSIVSDPLQLSLMNETTGVSSAVSSPLHGAPPVSPVVDDDDNTPHLAVKGIASFCGQASIVNAVSEVANREKIVVVKRATVSSSYMMTDDDDDKRMADDSCSSSDHHRSDEEEEMEAEEEVNLDLHMDDEPLSDEDQNNFSFELRPTKSGFEKFSTSITGSSNVSSIEMKNKITSSSSSSSSCFTSVVFESLLSSVTHHQQQQSLSSSSLSPCNSPSRTSTVITAHHTAHQKQQSATLNITSLIAPAHHVQNTSQQQQQLRYRPFGSRLYLQQKARSKKELLASRPPPSTSLPNNAAAKRSVQSLSPAANSRLLSNPKCTPKTSLSHVASASHVASPRGIIGSRAGGMSPFELPPTNRMIVHRLLKNGNNNASSNPHAANRGVSSLTSTPLLLSQRASGLYSSSTPPAPSLLCLPSAANNAAVLNMTPRTLAFTGGGRWGVLASRGGLHHAASSNQRTPSLHSPSFMALTRPSSRLRQQSSCVASPMVNRGNGTSMLLDDVTFLAPPPFPSVHASHPSTSSTKSSKGRRHIKTTHSLKKRLASIQKTQRILDQISSIYSNTSNEENVEVFDENAEGNLLSKTNTQVPTYLLKSSQPANSSANTNTNKWKQPLSSLLSTKATK